MASTDELANPRLCPNCELRLPTVATSYDEMSVAEYGISWGQRRYRGLRSHGRIWLCPRCADAYRRNVFLRAVGSRIIAWSFLVILGGVLLYAIAGTAAPDLAHSPLGLLLAAPTILGAIALIAGATMAGIGGLARRRATRFLLSPRRADMAAPPEPSTPMNYAAPAMTIPGVDASGAMLPTTPEERAALRRARRRRQRLIRVAGIGGWIAAVLVACTVFGLLLQSTQRANVSLPHEYRNALTTDAPGWAQDDLGCGLRDGAYHVAPTGENHSLTCFAPAGSYGNFNLEVKASLRAGSGAFGYGLAFRVGTSGDAYIFEITDEGRADVALVYTGHISVLSTLWQLPVAGRVAGSPHTLRVEARGDTFTCFVDGTRLGSLADGHYSFGRVGLFAGAPGQDATFTDFVVTSV